VSVQEPVYAQPVIAHDAQTRATFMKRVYGHLLMGIAGFFIAQWFLFTSELAYSIAEFVLGTSWLLILGGFMIVSWIANWMGVRARTPGAQYGAYALLVVANALIFATPLVLAREVAVQQRLGEFDIIQTAAYLSLFAFAALSVIAIRTGKDFSFLGSILRWLGVLALVAIVGAVIFGATLGTWFAVAMIGFAGAAILYDTQRVYRSYPPEMVVPAAMSLFASLALLFWYVLQLLMRR
jgi:FtsH-binding integral membrane protein